VVKDTETLKKTARSVLSVANEFVNELVPGVVIEENPVSLAMSMSIVHLLTMNSAFLMELASERIKSVEDTLLSNSVELERKINIVEKNLDIIENKFNTLQNQMKANLGGIYQGFAFLKDNEIPRKSVTTFSEYNEVNNESVKPATNLIDLSATISVNDGKPAIATMKAVAAEPLKFPPFKTTERWENIAGYPVGYKISTYGTVHSFKKRGRRGDKGEFTKEPTVLKVSGEGQVSLLTTRGIRSSEYVANLVLKTFVGLPPSTRHFVLHKDGNIYNFHLWNLEWSKEE